MFRLWPNKKAATIVSPRTAETVEADIARLKEAIPVILRDTAEIYIEQLRQLELMLLSPQPLKAEEEKLKLMQGILKKVVDALKAGFEPTNPPRNWYAGVIHWDSWKYSQIDRIWTFNNLFPNNNSSTDGEILVFKGVIPTSVQKKYLKAREIFPADHIRIYAPGKEYFQSYKISVDPRIIGLIRGIPDKGDMFFEIAAWDLAKDLQKMRS